MNDITALLAREIEACRRSSQPYDRFNSVVLQRPPYWAAQRAIGQALCDPSIRTICVKSGHMTGKSFCAAGFGLGWLTMEPESSVVLVAPSLQQLGKAVWAEVRQARAGSPLLCNAGRLTRQPMTLEYGEKWALYGIAATEPERIQGAHPKGKVLAIVDEASGVENPAIYEAIDSLKPDKKLLISNPIKNYGYFYEQCKLAESGDDPGVVCITIPSTDSPDIDLDVSPRGLADRRWLENMYADYGRDSQTIRVRVGAEFPDGDSDLLIPSDWLDRSQAASYYPSGPKRLAIDLGLGGGGDDAVHVVRDDGGIIEWQASKYVNLESSAQIAARLVEHHQIAPQRVSFDAEGIGADFDNRLRAVGIVGATPYKGKRASKNQQYVNMRTASHFALRRRLDPTRLDAHGNPRPIFHIPRDFMLRFRRECTALTYAPTSTGRTALRNADEVAAAIRHSPDYSVTLAQSFAWPNS